MAWLGLTTTPTLSVASLFVFFSFGFLLIHFSLVLYFSSFSVLSHAVTINPDTGKPVYSFRGQDGLELWSVLFFQPQEPPTQTKKTMNRCGEYNDSVLDHDVAVVSQGVPESKAAVMSFGHMLLERGILHNYTPHLQGRKQTAACNDYIRLALLLWPFSPLSETQTTYSC